jgi:FLYWCH zinc finger domain
MSFGVFGSHEFSRAGVCRTWTNTLSCLSGQGDGDEVRYIQSKRGTRLLYYQGNTYTPNSKVFEGQKTRSWKCGLYYKAKCRARVVTSDQPNRPSFRVAVAQHSHAPLFAKIKKDSD